MAIHTVAYYQSVGAALATPTAITAVDDQILAKAGTTGLIPSQNLSIVAAMAGGASAFSRARISSPSLAKLALPWIRPAMPAVNPETDNPMQSLVDAPLPVAAGEQLRIEAVTSGAVAVTALVWLADRVEPVPRGAGCTVRFTGTAAATAAGVWSPVAITLSEQLPAGRYAVIAAEVVASAGSPPYYPIAGRLVFPGQVYRPGVPAYDSLGDMQPDLFRNNLLGVFGYFDSFAPPSLELLVSQAYSNSIEGYLRVVQVAEGTGRPAGA